MSALSDWIKLYVFPPGRAIHAIEHVLARARAARLEAVIAACERALEDAHRLRELEARWARQRAGQSDPAAEVAEATAFELDSRIDKLLASLARLLESLRSLHGADDPARGKPAARLLDTLFPFGVFALTSLSYPEQLVAVRDILGKLRGELADDVAALGLENTRHQLAGLLADFADAVAPQAGAATLRFDDVQAARARCQDALLAVIATILGACPYNDTRSVERRTRLLHPIEEQRDAIARDMRRRRNATDITPTGIAAPQPEPEPESV